MQVNPADWLGLYLPFHLDKGLRTLFKKWWKILNSCCLWFTHKMKKFAYISKRLKPRLFIVLVYKNTIQTRINYHFFKFAGYAVLTFTISAWTVRCNPLHFQVLCGICSSLWYISLPLILRNCEAYSGLQKINYTYSQVFKTFYYSHTTIETKFVENWSFSKLNKLMDPSVWISYTA